jgi:uncharacterized protein
VNRLAGERSPYLLQHAQNPVDWFPWGDEAFAKARSEDKPIFLSIGYSTCHWCHVMEHESFESDAIAAALNGHYVSIKVDREERPDIDRVYMTFVQATTGSGGWPMSVWLTPDLKPFYGGTYFPPESRWGRPGFIDILQEIAKVWRADREKVTQSADSLTDKLRSVERTAASANVPDVAALESTVNQFRHAFDMRNGGFGDAPKFPRPSELLFLLREHVRTGHQDPLAMVLRTLQAMALGGMRDHIGGGFHRYSVDAGWRVPHFEKMLYDQAQLVLAYVEAAQASGGDPFYLEVAEDTLLYVLREMTDPDGGFYSAEDADSVPPEQAGQPDAHKMEGAFYLWRRDELEPLLGADASIVASRFGIEPDGNAPSDPQQEFTGKNLLYVSQSIEDIAARTGRSVEDVENTVDRARVTLFQHRLTRPRPQRDDKILTAWNGLMIGALARTARVLQVADGGGAAAAAPYLLAGRRAATFFRERMWDAQSRRLLRRYRQGDASIDAYAEDYASLIFGLLELFQADADPQWLEWALTLQRRQDELFWDEAGAGWFSTTGRDPSVLLRVKEDYDGAEPSASSLSVTNLLVLSHLVDDPAWAGRIERTFKASGAALFQMGRGVPMMGAALSAYLAGLQQIVIVEGSPQATPESGGEDSSLERAIGQRYLPFAIHLRLASGMETEARERLGRLLPFVAAMEPVNGRTAIYVCRNQACRAPATTVQELEGALGA